MPSLPLSPRWEGVLNNPNKACNRWDGMGWAAGDSERSKGKGEKREERNISGVKNQSVSSDSVYPVSGPLLLSAQSIQVSMERPGTRTAGILNDAGKQCESFFQEEEEGGTTCSKVGSLSRRRSGEGCIHMKVCLRAIFQHSKVIR